MGEHVARMERDEVHTRFTFTLIMLNAQQKEQMSVSVNKVPFVIQCCDLMLCAAVSIRSVVWCIKCGTADRSYCMQL